MKFITLLALLLSMSANGCSLTPQIEPFASTSPVTADAAEGHLDVITIPPIEESTNDENVSATSVLPLEHKAMKHRSKSGVSPTN